MSGLTPVEYLRLRRQHGPLADLAKKESLELAEKAQRQIHQLFQRCIAQQQTYQEFISSTLDSISAVDLTGATQEKIDILLKMAHSVSRVLQDNTDLRVSGKNQSEKDAEAILEYKKSLAAAIRGEDHI